MTRDRRDAESVLREADALLRRGEPVEARAVLEQASRADDGLAGIPEYHALLGQACQNAGDHAAARDALTAALGRRPHWPQVLHLRALALRDLGRLDDARADIVAALGGIVAVEEVIDPARQRAAPRGETRAESSERRASRIDDARAWTTLGTIELRRGDLMAARAALERAIALAPDHAPAWRALAETLQSADATDAALEAWRRWVELNRDRAGASAQFGAALARAHRWDEAEAVLSVAAAAPGATPETMVRLGHVRGERGDATGALDAFMHASARWPLRPTPAFAAKLFLPQIYASTADVAAWRTRYVQGLSALEEALPVLVASRPEVGDLDWTNFYLAYQGENDLPLQRRHAALVARLAASSGSAATNFGASRHRRPGSRLRVGFASSFFHTCTVGAYFGAWPLGLDRSRFEVFAIHYGHAIDATTQSLRSGAEHFIRAPAAVSEIAAAVLAADLDVLVYPQLGMDGRDATLAALRLAPLQCCAWGHPETTGSAAIDAFISVASMEPRDAVMHYSERLVLLPGIGTRYAQPAVRDASRREFGLPESGRLYACPQSLFKIHPENDAMLAGVLASDPSGAMVLCGDWTQPSAIRFHARLARALDDRAIDPARLLRQPLRPPAEFRAMLSTCDVMVDTLRWSGGNTALDALAARLPIVTCEGALMRGRQSAAMLRMIGLADLVVERPASMPQRAVDVAKEAPRYRRHVHDHLGALFDRDEPLAALGDALVALAEERQATGTSPDC
jgi:CRISPR-associated protein Csy1